MVLWETAMAKCAVDRSQAQRLRRRPRSSAARLRLARCRPIRISTTRSRVGLRTRTCRTGTRCHRRTALIWLPTSKLLAALAKRRSRAIRSRFRQSRRSRRRASLTAAELFQKMECWKCHGQQGRGDGPSAATLTDSKDQPIRPYDFADGNRRFAVQVRRDQSRISIGSS